tara:strand:- start:19744 stop:20229 length:486 start_codon:yes stop_codon:yes gene_type:complete
MTIKPWLSRALALTAVVCAGLTLSSAVAIISAVVDVGRAKKDPVPTAVSTAITPQPWTSPLPVLRLADRDPKAQIGEYLNGQLGGLGLTLQSVEVTSMRPLGGGLQLALVKIEGRWSIDDGQAAANWVAVNRDAIRLTSMTIAAEPDGQERSSLNLLIVVA